MSGEAENQRDDMIIDEPRSELMRINAVPDEFNPNYLKVYYGKFRLVLISFYTIIHHLC